MHKLSGFFPNLFSPTQLLFLLFPHPQKSKCCCIYKKPLKFGESDSEDSDSDCEHCSHHTPKDFIAARDGEREERPDGDDGESNGDGQHGDGGAYSNGGN